MKDINEYLNDTDFLRAWLSLTNYSRERILGMKEKLIHLGGTNRYNYILTILAYLDGMKDVGAIDKSSKDKLFNFIIGEGEQYGEDNI